MSVSIAAYTYRKGSEKNITMATHLEVTQRQWDACCYDALLKLLNNMTERFKTLMAAM